METVIAEITAATALDAITTWAEKENLQVYRLRSQGMGQVVHFSVKGTQRTLNCEYDNRNRVYLIRELLS